MTRHRSIGFDAEVVIAGLEREMLEVEPRQGIGGFDNQFRSGREASEGLAGAQHGQGALQATQIENDAHAGGIVGRDSARNGCQHSDVRAKARFHHQIARTAGRPGVSVERKFGGDALCVDGRIIGFASKDDMLVLKLPEARVSELLEAGAAAFRSGGRVMREWVALDPAANLPFDDLVDESLRFVGPES